MVYERGGGRVCRNKHVLAADTSPLVCFDVFLEVVLAAEPFAAGVARVRPDACVDELVSGELLVARERLVAIRMIAPEWPLASMNSHMSPQLSVVGEGHFARGTLEVFGPILAGARAGARLYLLGRIVDC